MKPVAFVDVETTGLSPATDRIAEVAVVAVDADQVDRWTTFVRVPSRRTSECFEGHVDGGADAPFFRDIAGELARRLSGRLLVAHNARFDHAFLKAEFDRVGVSFNSEVLCSLMLSRKLYPHLAHHDLDSLVDHHGLRSEARHRALPDADLVWQWWKVIHEECPRDLIGKTIENLLAGPVLPAHLDPALIERLPEAPGAYVFHGESDHPLLVGAARNLKRHILNYFRIDRASAKALEYGHRITNITWRATRGFLGAQLQAAALDSVLFATAKRKINAAAFTWQFSPNAIPSIAVRPLADCAAAEVPESFGLFASERKARNALVRLATRYRLCHGLLGISASGKRCEACRVDQAGACVGPVSRKRQLIRLFAAIAPLRVPRWPYRGPVGIRERTDIHVIDRWQFLGTARSENDLYGLLEHGSRSFDKELYFLLNRTLDRYPSSKIVDLSRYDSSAGCFAAVPPGVGH